MLFRLLFWCAFLSGSVLCATVKENSCHDHNVIYSKITLNDKVKHTLLKYFMECLQSIPFDRFQRIGHIKVTPMFDCHISLFGQNALYYHVTPEYSHIDHKAALSKTTTLHFEDCPYDVFTQFIVIKISSHCDPHYLFNHVKQPHISLFRIQNASKKDRAYLKKILQQQQCPTAQKTIELDKAAIVTLTKNTQSLQQIRDQITMSEPTS